MKMPKFSFLKPRAVFPAEAKPDVQISDLARLPLTDPFAKAVFQIAYQGWEQAYLRLIQPDLTPELRAHAAGRTLALHEFIIGLEKSHAAAREKAKG